MRVSIPSGIKNYSVLSAYSEYFFVLREFVYLFLVVYYSRLYIVAWVTWG